VLETKLCDGLLAIVLLKPLKNSTKKWNLWMRCFIQMIGKGIKEFFQKNFWIF